MGCQVNQYRFHYFQTHSGFALPLVHFLDVLLWFLNRRPFSVVTWPYHEQSALLCLQVTTCLVLFKRNTPNFLMSVWGPNLNIVKYTHESYTGKPPFLCIRLHIHGCILPHLTCSVYILVILISYVQYFFFCLKNHSVSVVRFSCNRRNKEQFAAATTF